MPRVILHCDCNSFYASVETALNPEYKNVPMAVCGSESDRHGIVLAKNELAKKFNIVTAETVYSAKKKCPNLVITSPHHDEYLKFSKRVNQIYSRYTDVIEAFGIDESWLDVTASQRLFGNGMSIAEKIRREVKEEIGITVSIGVSFNKVFAKLGSDYKKPDAITLIDKDNFRDIVFPLPVSDLLFVGNKTTSRLTSLGIKTIGDLARTNRKFLIMKFGKMGDVLYKYANGLDDSPVEAVREDAKSISCGLTFKHDLISFNDCRVGINYLVEKLGARLRKYGQLCGTVSLTVKDNRLHSIQRQRQINPRTDITKEISNVAYKILCDEWHREVPIRMITVSVSNLQKKIECKKQITFFENEEENKREKNSKRDIALDKIRQKFGANSIMNGSVIDTDIGIYELD